MRVRWASTYADAVSVALALILLGRLPVGCCQGFSGGINPPPTSPLLWLLNDAVDNLTSNIFPEVKDRFGFCIKDPWVFSNPLLIFFCFFFFALGRFDLETRCGVWWSCAYAGMFMYRVLQAGRLGSDI